MPPGPPPEDQTWRLDRPAMTCREREDLLAGGVMASSVPLSFKSGLSARAQNQSTIEYMAIASSGASGGEGSLGELSGRAHPSNRASAPNLPVAAKPPPPQRGVDRPSQPGIYYADGFEEPLPEGTYDRRTSAPLRPSASEGALGPASRDGNANEYLEKLPPVLRRSVMGTGPRQHTARGHQKMEKNRQERKIFEDIAGKRVL